MRDDYTSEECALSLCNELPSNRSFRLPEVMTTVGALRRYPQLLAGRLQRRTMYKMRA